MLILPEYEQTKQVCKINNNNNKTAGQCFIVYTSAKNYQNNIDHSHLRTPDEKHPQNGEVFLSWLL